MSELDLAGWLSRLEQLHPTEIELGLDRVSSVAHRLGLLEPACPVVTVAGTNGKGSTIAVLDQILRSSGKRTGVYTSPHLFKYNERICIDGEMATDTALVDSFCRIDKARQEISLTYFEFSTLAALDLFQRSELDVVLLEVGLGGRLDAANIIDPDIAIITSIALDHEGWLGNDRETIALEKAGILRKGGQFVCADLDPCVSLASRAVELECQSVYISAEEASLCGQGVALRGENIAAAKAAAAGLGVSVSADELKTCAREARISGRMQHFSLDGLELLVDVAHNQASVENLAEYLSENPIRGRTVAVFGALSDKNIHAMISTVRDNIAGWFLTDLPSSPRGISTAEIGEVLRAAGENMISESDNPRQAYRRARSVVSNGDRIVIFGSFFTVAAVLPAIEKDRKKLE